MSNVKVPSGFGLVEGEAPYWYGRMSWKANWALLLLGILTIWIYGLGIIFFILAALRVYSTEYFITNRRIYVKYGLISRHVMEVKLEWVTGTNVAQGFIGRILNYGNVILSTPGQYAGSVVMIGVSNPMHIRTIVEDLIRKYKERERIYEKIRTLEQEYEFGRISEVRYRELRRKYEEELKKYM